MTWKRRSSRRHHPFPLYRHRGLEKVEEWLFGEVSFSFVAI